MSREEREYSEYLKNTGGIEQEKQSNYVFLEGQECLPGFCSRGMIGKMKKGVLSMYREIAKLVLYRDLGEDSILRRLAGIFEDWEKKGGARKAELTTPGFYEQIKALLDLSTVYGFDTNLWHNYLTFILLTNENSFSMTSEKVGANDGTVNHFARGDFAISKAVRL